MSEFEYMLSAVAIMKYEEPYVAEWVEYHRQVGFQHFYIYDNNEVSNMPEVLKHYIDHGIVTLIPKYGPLQQFPAYNDAIKQYKDVSKYMAFIDADEFVFPVQGGKVCELVDQIFHRYSNMRPGGLGINWSIFDDGGHVSRPKGLVIENYFGRAQTSENKHIKTIVDPRTIKYFANPHFPMYEFGYCCINEHGERIEGPFCETAKRDILRINHYFFKSEEEYKFRLTRKKGDIIITEDQLQKVLNELKSKVDKSQSIHDDSMLRYSDSVKLALIQNGYNIKTGFPK